MNDLMTKSFQSYVELKKQARLDLEREGADLESGLEDENLTQFFQEAELIKIHMKEIGHLLHDLQTLNEKTKSTHSAKILRGLQARMESDIYSVLRKAQIVKTRLESLDKSNLANRKISFKYGEGSAVDRTRISTTNGLRARLRDLMNGFRALRENIVSDYKDGLKRRYFNATGECPTEEIIEKMMASRNGAVEVFENRADVVNAENRERHEAVMDIRSSLNRLHQVFLDVAVMVETQGESIDVIEKNVEVAASFVGGGTNSLFYANQAKKGRKWTCCWVLGVVFVILLVCVVAMFTN